MTVLLLLVTLQAALPGGLPARLELLPRTETCGAQPTADEVTVCVRRDDRLRLPLPAEREGAARDGPIDGESPRASIDGARPCGIFAGQRNCDKREAARYGYGGGRDPVTVGSKLLRRLFDPDAELGEAASLPKR